MRTKQWEPPAIVWHYTTGERYLEIIEDGEIKTESEVGNSPIKNEVSAPGVWFSVRQDFEPTAIKSVADSKGNIRTGTFQETFFYGKGLIRIGVLFDSPFLISWEQWSKVCNDEAHVRSLKDVAKEAGSHVRGFRVSLEDVPKEQWAKVQVWVAGLWFTLKDFGEEVIEEVIAEG